MPNRSVRRRSRYGRYLAHGRIREGCFDPPCIDCAEIDDIVKEAEVQGRAWPDTYRRIVMRHHMRTATPPLSARMKGKRR